MNTQLFPDIHHFYPAIVRERFDSPIDALISLGVPADEATDLVAASWSQGCAGSIVTTTFGGRHIAVVAQGAGRWAACNFFAEALCTTQIDAERRLLRLFRPGTRGSAGILSLVCGEIALTEDFGPSSA